MKEIEWDYDEKPERAGWYAVLYCWEAAEGSFVSSDYWTGSAWELTSPVISFSSSSFATEEEAEEWAELNDCSW